MNLCPMTITEAKAFVAAHHRHHKPPVSGLFAVAAEENGVIIAVAVVGRPVARMLADGYTAEVTRLCSTVAERLANGHAPGVCSMLYAAAWRACRALGYRRLVTYTLPEEGGGKPSRRGVAPRG